METMVYTLEVGVGFTGPSPALTTPPKLVKPR